MRVQQRKEPRQEQQDWHPKSHQFYLVQRQGEQPLKGERKALFKASFQQGRSLSVVPEFCQLVFQLFSLLRLSKTKRTCPHKNLEIKRTNTAAIIVQHHCSLTCLRRQSPTSRRKRQQHYRWCFKSSWHCFWQLLISQFWFSIITNTSMMSMVHASCSVRDKHGKMLDLNVLPYGVNYHEQLDLIECVKPSSCRNWKISDCSEVYCLQYGACQDTQLNDNTVVTCAASTSCHNAHFYNGHTIICGGANRPEFDDNGQKTDPQVHFCTSAFIQTDANVICEGPQACVAQDRATRMTIRVGRKGHVRCGNIISKEPSCKNIDIEIQHAQQACIDTFGGLARGCAVICVNEWDCDEDSIQFRITHEIPPLPPGDNEP